MASSYETRLDSYLPDELLCEAYAELGLTTLYDWQAQCLCLPGVLEGRNLVSTMLSECYNTKLA